MRWLYTQTQRILTITSKLITTAHRLNKIPIHTSAIAAIVLSKIADEKKVLMLKRTKDHFWSYVSGSIEANETAMPQINVPLWLIIQTSLYSSEVLNKIHNERWLYVYYCTIN